MIENNPVVVYVFNDKTVVDNEDNCFQKQPNTFERGFVYLDEKQGKHSWIRTCSFALFNGCLTLLLTLLIILPRYFLENTTIF